MCGRNGPLSIYVKAYFVAYHLITVRLSPPLSEECSLHSRTPLSKCANVFAALNVGAVTTMFPPPTHACTSWRTMISVSVQSTFFECIIQQSVFLSHPPSHTQLSITTSLLQNPFTVALSVSTNYLATRQTTVVLQYHDAPTKCISAISSNLSHSIFFVSIQSCFHQHHKNLFFLSFFLESFFVWKSSIFSFVVSVRFDSAAPYPVLWSSSTSTTDQVLSQDDLVQQLHSVSISQLEMDSNVLQSILFWMEKITWLKISVLVSPAETFPYFPSKTVQKTSRIIVNWSLVSAKEHECDHFQSLWISKSSQKIWANLLRCYQGEPFRNFLTFGTGNFSKKEIDINVSRDLQLNYVRR